MSELVKDVATYKKETVDMLIKFYNIQNNKSYKVSNTANRQSVINALDVCNDNIAKIKDFVRNNKFETVQECFDRFFEQESLATPVISAQQEIQAEPVSNQEQVVNYSMGLLEKAVVGLIAQTQAEKIEGQIMASVEQKVKDFIKDEYGTIERKVNVVVNEKKVEMKGVTHEKFEQILKFVANDEPVFLTGPAGCGKNVVCQQVAEALGLPFYFTNAVTQEYKITGFTDAMGTFQETPFYKAFTQGGLFMLDEMDASIPEVLIILNAAIANRYFDFPAPIGMVKAHPNFRVISAGNTFGQGADFQYVGRNQLDMASLDRFALIKMNYSENIELAVAGGDEELVNFCREYRKTAQSNGLNIIVSYRAIGRLAKMIKTMDLKDALETCLVKGIGKDNLNMLVAQMSSNKYTKALKDIAKNMDC